MASTRFSIEEIDTAVFALRDAERSGFFGPSDEQRVEAVLDAVFPLYEERIRREATSEAVHMITAVVYANGGHLAIPMSTYKATEFMELQRYDDADTQSIVFEVPMSNVA